MTSPEVRSRDDLCAAISAGASFKYLTFWGHTPASPGVVDRSCFSQWFPSPFVVDGRTFPTAEHFMMVRKAELFDAHDIATQVLATGEPGAAKALGRKIRGFDEVRWVEHREAVVTEGSIHKFKQNPSLHTFLLGTADRVLVEASPTDAIWGIGADAKSPVVTTPQSWPGLNLLGFALMEARHRLRMGGA